MTHFVHTFSGRLHFVHTFRGAQNTLCEIFWAAGNFTHTFSGQDRTSCTLFKAVLRNLCVLALRPVHTVRPPTGCPVPPRAPSARPAWIKSCGLCCIYSWHQGQRQRPRRAAAARLQAGAEQNNADASEARSRRRGDHAPFSLRLNDHS